MNYIVGTLIFAVIFLCVDISAYFRQDKMAQYGVPRAKWLPRIIAFEAFITVMCATYIITQG